MKKTVKLTAALSAAALMALAGAAGNNAVLSDILGGMVSYAAEGWQQSGGTWYYYGSDGNPVTDELKRSDGIWYYLGSDGTMQTDYMYEDEDENIYYFNSDGAMVTNSWLLYEDGGESNWYYFDGSGKAAKRKSDSDNIYTRSIDGKTYGFDEDGRMLYGWVDEDGELIEDEEDAFMDAKYYFGDFDDGQMRKNTWELYEETSEEESNVDGIKYEDKDELWFFFDSSGKKVVPSEGKETIEKTINGSKYIFDQNGVMLSDWIKSTSSTASPSFKYFSGDEDGHMRKETWIYAVPSKEMDEEDYDNDEYSWFYVNKSGKAYTDGIDKVKGKKYAFDDKGRMQTEFVLLDGDGKFKDNFTVEDDDIESDDFKDSSSDLFDDISSGTLYYFDADEENGGQMKTGKSVKVELADDTYTFGFNKDGKAYGSGGKLEEQSRKYYINGLLLAADKEAKYGVVQTEDGFVVVNSSGTIQKGNEKSVKDGNGGYILINEDKYYGYYDDDDHKPVWDEDGVPHEYDSDADNKEGEPIGEDQCASIIPDDMVVYRAN